MEDGQIRKPFATRSTPKIKYFVEKLFHLAVDINIDQTATINDRQQLSIPIATD